MSRRPCSVVISAARAFPPRPKERGVRLDDGGSGLQSISSVQSAVMEHTYMYSLTVASARAKEPNRHYHGRTDAEANCNNRNIDRLKQPQDHAGLSHTPLHRT